MTNLPATCTKDRRWCLCEQEAAGPKPPGTFGRYPARHNRPRSASFCPAASRLWPGWAGLGPRRAAHRAGCGSSLADLGPRVPFGLR